jgi:hypothetical protein
MTLSQKAYNEQRKVALLLVLKIATRFDGIASHKSWWEMKNFGLFVVLSASWLSCIWFRVFTMDASASMYRFLTSMSPHPLLCMVLSGSCWLPSLLPTLLFILLMSPVFWTRSYNLFASHGAWPLHVNCDGSCFVFVFVVVIVMTWIYSWAWRISAAADLGFGNTPHHTIAVFQCFWCMQLGERNV